VSAAAEKRSASDTAQTKKAWTDARLELEWATEELTRAREREAAACTAAAETDRARMQSRFDELHATRVGSAAW
jgi:hypothetical protein